MKTIRQHLETLPPGYRERALANHNLHPAPSADEAVETVSTALLRGFVWSRSSEGLEFWGRVHAHVCVPEGNEMPPLPDVPPAQSPEGPASYPHPELPFKEIADAKPSTASALPPHFRAETAARVFAAAYAGDPEGRHSDARLAEQAVAAADALIKELSS